MKREKMKKILLEKVVPTETSTATDADITYSDAIKFIANEDPDTGVLTITVTYTWGANTATKEFDLPVFKL